MAYLQLQQRAVPEEYIQREILQTTHAHLLSVYEHKGNEIGDKRGGYRRNVGYCYRAMDLTDYVDTNGRLPSKANKEGKSIEINDIVEEILREFFHTIKVIAVTPKKPNGKIDAQFNYYELWIEQERYREATDLYCQKVSERREINQGHPNI